MKKIDGWTIAGTAGVTGAVLGLAAINGETRPISFTDEVVEPLEGNQVNPVVEHCDSGEFYTNGDVVVLDERRGEIAKVRLDGTTEMPDGRHVPLKLNAADYPNGVVANDAAWNRGFFWAHECESVDFDIE